MLRLCKERAVDPYDLELDAGKLALILNCSVRARSTAPERAIRWRPCLRTMLGRGSLYKEGKLAIERDDTAVARAIAQVLAENADAVEKFRAGNEKGHGLLTGQCMKLLRGKADPKQVSAALLEAVKIDRWFERRALPERAERDAFL